ncbi:Zinc finger, RING-CH-type [Kalmanozyma brasiliensis GHG001]|uniref:RING-CH-type domain-containing protein n=1 Tax=Kalmanozyma brasiliensis (strain GHG001) TaxID=1365824 RepID=V5EUQ3_KALBG|nr:Zinc finger, RING-CH-type [Kalmanozyma brasiliensis GHG001]EST05879.1 Zinc finger, RING-CH-type [Kalmanozyma brasiliensis GHG001]
MSDREPEQAEASGSRPRTPPPSSPVQIDIARLENDLIPSPPASATQRFGGTSAPSSSVSNVDGSARVYRFPNDLPPRFEGSPTNPDPNERVVTVRDLRTKSCWICSEDDEDPLPSSSQSSSSSAASSRPKRFVHPCKCTLVAHESCLLRWIDQSKRNHPLQDHVTCPQCKAPYILINNKTPLLKVFEFFDKIVTRVEPYGAVAVVGGSVLIACTTYGCVAIRMFLGKDAASRALASPWPWHYWIDIPLIPFALIASRLNVFESAMTWVPTLVAFPITSIPMVTATAAHGRLFERYVESSAFNARAYPPGPALTALLIPWIRAFYLALKRRVYRTVLKPFYSGQRSDGSTRSTGTRRNRRRVIIVGDPDSYLVDGDAPLGAQPMPDGIGGPVAQVRDDRATDDDSPTQTVYVTHHSFARLCLGALSLPFVANLMGRVLARLARLSPLLARFLGMRNVVPATSILSSFYTTKATPTSSDATPSPIASLFRGQLPLFDRQPPSYEEDTFADRLTLLGSSTRYDDLDPVWFRNAVGAGLYILVKDAGSLLYRYLRLSQRDRTTIKDLPFQSGLVSGLDLRD